MQCDPSGGGFSGLRALRLHLHIATENRRLKEIPRPGQHQVGAIRSRTRVGSAVQFSLNVALRQDALDSVVGTQKECGPFRPELLLVTRHAWADEYDLTRLLGDFRVVGSQMSLLRAGNIQ